MEDYVYKLKDESGNAGDLREKLLSMIWPEKHT